MKTIPGAVTQRPSAGTSDKSLLGTLAPGPAELCQPTPNSVPPGCGSGSGSTLGGATAAGAERGTLTRAPSLSAHHPARSMAAGVWMGDRRCPREHSERLALV